MSAPNAAAIRTAENKLERIARDYYRAWLAADPQAYEKATRELRLAAVRYTRARDRGRAKR